LFRQKTQHGQGPPRPPQKKNSAGIQIKLYTESLPFVLKAKLHGNLNSGVIDQDVSNYIFVFALQILIKGNLPQ
jgi:hypothetical protein